MVNGPIAVIRLLDAATAVAELTRAIRFAKELGYREKTERLGAELASEDRGPAQAK